MSCASGIYVVNANSQAVSDSGTLNPGTVIRRYGRNVGQIGTGVILDGKGYYYVNANVVLNASGTGTVGIDLLSDGVVVEGATATGAVAPDSSVTLPVHAVIRITCCEKPTTVQVRVRGTGVTVLNSAITVLKV